MRDSALNPVVRTLLAILILGSNSCSPIIATAPLSVAEARMAELWDAKNNVPAGDGFYGPWGPHGGRWTVSIAEKLSKDEGEWSWQQNPFVGTKPYQGLLVVLMMLNSSDLKNSNNTLYQLAEPHVVAARWYVVRDLGTALGETGRLNPTRSDPDLFERTGFIKGVKGGFVEFDYHGLQQGLLKNRIAPDDVRWADRLLQKVSDEQLHEAFRAGGYERGIADRFIRRLRAKAHEVDERSGAF
jgi:hypothetical protein